MYILPHHLHCYRERRPGGPGRGEGGGGTVTIGQGTHTKRASEMCKVACLDGSVD